MRKGGRRGREKEGRERRMRGMRERQEGKSHTVIWEGKKQMGE